MARQKRAKLIEVAVDDLICTPDNPRVINESSEDFKELMASVKETGVRIPVLARPHPDGDGKYDLRYGARRVLAAKLAGRKTVPTIVREMTDAEAFEETFIENYSRNDLTPLEQSRAVSTLLERFRGDVRAVAAKLGHTEKWVRLRARLQKLTPKWREAIADPQEEASHWTPGHLELIARLPAATQDEALDELGGWPEPTVSAVERQLNDRFLRRLSGAPWDLEDATLYPKAPPCSECPKRTSRQGVLFLDDLEEETVKKQDRCLDVACWQRKLAAYIAQRAKELKAEHPNLAFVITNYPSNEEIEEIVELRKAWGHVQMPFEFSAAKNSADGAQPALVVHGPGAGKLKWIKPSGGYQADRERAGGSPGTPTPLNERREKLNAKRLAAVLKDVQAKLQRVEWPDLKEAEPGLLLRLLAAFGTHAVSHHAFGGDEWTYFDKTKPGECLNEAWRHIRALLHSRLASNAPITETPPQYRQEAIRVTKLCGFDMKAIKAEAAQTYPEPKAWKHLNADGTPKKAATTKRRKK